MSGNTLGPTHCQSLTCGSFTSPANSVNDASVTAGSNIDADKLQHRFNAIYSQQPSTATAATDRKVIHVAGATSTVNSFYCGLRTACVGDSTVSFDVKKNNTSLLGSVVTITSTTAAYGLVAGTLSSTSLAADDVVEVVVSVSAGTGTLGTGGFARLIVDQNSP